MEKRSMGEESLLTLNEEELSKIGAHANLVVDWAAHDSEVMMSIRNSLEENHPRLPPPQHLRPVKVEVKVEHQEAHRIHPLLETVRLIKEIIEVIEVLIETEIEIETATVTWSIIETTGNIIENRERAEIVIALVIKLVECQIERDLIHEQVGEFHHHQEGKGLIETGTIRRGNDPDPVPVLANEKEKENQLMMIIGIITNDGNVFSLKSS